MSIETLKRAYSELKPELDHLAEQAADLLYAGQITLDELRDALGVFADYVIAHHGDGTGLTPTQAARRLGPGYDRIKVSRLTDGVPVSNPARHRPLQLVDPDQLPRLITRESVEKYRASMRQTGHTPSEPTMTYDEAMERLGISRPRISQLVKSGRLERAGKRGPHNLVTARSVHKFERDRKP